MNKSTAARSREGFQHEDDGPFEERPIEPPFNREVDQPATKTVKPAEEKQDQPPLDEEQWPMVIKLRKPLPIGNHKTVTELSLREPTTNDIMNAGGNPCRIEIIQLTGNQAAFSPIIDDGKMLRLIANLSDILEPFLKKLDPRDYNTVAYQLRRFFLPEGKLW